MVQCLGNCEGRITDPNDDLLYMNLPRLYVKASLLFEIDINNAATPSLSSFLNAESSSEKVRIEQQFGEEFISHVRKEMAKNFAELSGKRNTEDANEGIDEEYDIVKMKTSCGIQKGTKKTKINNNNNNNTNSKRSKTNSIKTNSILNASNLTFKVLVCHITNYEYFF